VEREVVIAEAAIFFGANKRGRGEGAGRVVASRRHVDTVSQSGGDVHPRFTIFQSVATSARMNAAMAARDSSSGAIAYACAAPPSMMKLRRAERDTCPAW
jgi:hypothetical protein